MVRANDWTGHRFGALLVKERCPVIVPCRGAFWICQCDCGKEHRVSASSLVAGKSKSCGCQKGARIALIKKKKPGETGLNTVYTQYRANAAARKIGWFLTKEQFKEIATKDCDYCGQPPSNWRSGSGKASYASRESWEHGFFAYNGVDRSDPGGDYTLENCRPACGMCNYAKSRMSESDFLTWVTRIAHHRQLFPHA